MGRAKKIFKKFRVILLLIFLVFAIAAIHPSFSSQGIAIRNIVKNSSAEIAGMVGPKPTAMPMSRERIIAINNRPINSLEEYYNIVKSLEKPDRAISIKTNKKLYNLNFKPLTETIVLNETEFFEVPVMVNVTEDINGTNITKTVQATKTITKIKFNETTNQSYTVKETINLTETVERNKTITNIIGVQDLGLSVYQAPTNNIRKGLELQGGTRVLLQPEEELDENMMGMLLDNMKQRLNVYGLSDVVVREAGDLSGNQYILVEIAGATEQEVKDLLAKQGKFEARIGDKTVFIGGRDITHVCRSAECAGIDPNYGCGPTNSNQDQWVCRFRFSITLTPEAAQRQADATAELEVVAEGRDEYLSKKLELFLDDGKVDELNIGADLKGHAVTDIAISGSGVSNNNQGAVSNALQNMKRLQTILITGSLPVKLKIVKTDAISPVLGSEFVKNALMVGLFAIIAVVIVVFLRYRKWQVAVPMMINLTAEVIIILGVASFIGWNLDLAAIAGIIIAVGTGVDHQIVITDETLKGEKSYYMNWKQRIKNAFFIIIAAYFTTVVAMIPLMFAGAGLLRGFAITTIIGVSIGVFVTRPAYAAVVEVLLQD